MDCNEHINVFSFGGYDNEVILNNLTIIYEKKFHYFDYKSYRVDVLKEIN